MKAPQAGYLDLDLGLDLIQGAFSGEAAKVLDLDLNLGLDLDQSAFCGEAAGPPSFSLNSQFHSFLPQAVLIGYVMGVGSTNTDDFRYPLSSPFISCTIAEKETGRGAP